MMSHKYIELESGPEPKQTSYSVEELTTPISPNTSRPLSGLESYQLLVGDVDKTTDQKGESLYHKITAQERKVHRWYIWTAVAMYIAIAAQIILCLGIVVGTQRHLAEDHICILAAVNTAVAASIGILKALGLPDKKGVERGKLRKLAERIRSTTQKLRAGVIEEASEEAEDLRKGYEAAHEETHFKAWDFASSLTTGLKGLKD